MKKYQPAKAPATRVYTPDMNRGWGLRSWLNMAGNLFESRELIWRLFVRDFSARYRQTLLGVAWALIMPLVVVGTFVFLNRSGVLNIGEISIPYPAYALLGITIWQIFAGGLAAASNSIVAGGGMVVKINFAKESLVIASLGQTMVETSIRTAMVALVFAWYKLVPAWTVIFLPFSLIPLALFTLGLGFFLALANAVVRDVANIVMILTTFLMFLTPVLYPTPATGPFRTFAEYNPLTHLINASRDLVVSGAITRPDAYLWASLLSAGLFVIFWRFFFVAQMKMAERMGAR